MKAKPKNPAAVALGSLGGKARKKALSAKELSEQGKKAAKARWSNTGKTPSVRKRSAKHLAPPGKPKTTSSNLKTVQDKQKLKK